MLIIFGETTSDKKIGEGGFYCPACRREAGYVHMRVKNYFSVYFLPIIPTGTAGEYVECALCGEQFDAGILNAPPDWLKVVDQPWNCPACDNANPPEYDRCISCDRPRPEGGHPPPLRDGGGQSPGPSRSRPEGARMPRGALKQAALVILVLLAAFLLLLMLAYGINRLVKG